MRSERKADRICSWSGGGVWKRGVENGIRFYFIYFYFLPEQPKGGEMGRQGRSGAVICTQTFACYACDFKTTSALYKERSFEYPPKRGGAHKLRIKGNSFNWINLAF